MAYNVFPFHQRSCDSISALILSLSLLFLSLIYSIVLYNIQMKPGKNNKYHHNLLVIGISFVLGFCLLVAFECSSPILVPIS